MFYEELPLESADLGKDAKKCKKSPIQTRKQKENKLHFCVTAKNTM
jgi:hypothetical protein